MANISIYYNMIDMLSYIRIKLASLSISRDKGSKSRSVSTTCPRSHSKEVAKLDSNPGQSNMDDVYKSTKIWKYKVG